jgi:hypothetical protein
MNSFLEEVWIDLNIFGVFQNMRYAVGDAKLFLL